VNRSHPEFPIRLVGPFQAALRSRHEIRVKKDPNFSTQKVEKNRHAFAIGHAFEQPEAGREDAFDHANLSARRELRAPFKLDEAPLVFTASEAIDDSVRHRGRAE
jgi:hypothetical protein